MRTTVTITMDEFTTGLFAALAHLGVRRVYLGPDFHAGVQAAHERLAGIGTDLRFNVIRNPDTGLSGDVNAAIARAVQRGVIRRDRMSATVLRIQVAPERSSSWLGRLPGGAQPYFVAADALLDAGARVS